MKLFTKLIPVAVAAAGFMLAMPAQAYDHHRHHHYDRSYSHYTYHRSYRTVVYDDPYYYDDYYYNRPAYYYGGGPRFVFSIGGGHYGHRFHHFR